MIIDARHLPPDCVIRSDVCVVGAGPVGISVSRELRAAGLSVALLDSGGLTHDPAANRLDEPAEIDFGGVRRLGNTRRVGGNANAWLIRTGATRRGVRMLPLSPSDIGGGCDPESRAWPISFDQLEQYVARAQTVFDLPQMSYNGELWAGRLRDELVDADSDVRAAVFQFANGARFVERSVEAIATSDAIRLYHHATAAEILTSPGGGRAIGVRARTLPGRDLIVEAQHVVVAAGGIAGTRLLLASDRERPEGLGNLSGHLGRYFMDHPLVDGGELRPASRADFDHRAFYDIRVVEGTPIMGHIQLTEEAIKRESLLNLSLLLFPRRPASGNRLSERQKRGVSSAMKVREALIRKHLPSAEDAWNATIGVDGALKKKMASMVHPVASLGRGGWSQMSSPSRRFTHFEVIHQAEQAPHWENRVTLSNRLDDLGLRQVSLHVKWHEEDMRATVRAQHVFADALRRLGWGEFHVAHDEDGLPLVRSHSSNHFMGTTRMSSSPATGVVDEYGAVHGTENLFVASSSVFPSGGFANVTLTAVALALRTADTVIARSRTVALPSPAPLALSDSGTQVALGDDGGGGTPVASP